MPVYVVEHQGKRYKVEADTPQQAAGVFDTDPTTQAAESLLSKDGPLTDEERAAYGQLEENLAYKPARTALAGGLKRAPLSFAEGAGSLALDVAKPVSGLLTGGATDPLFEQQEQRFEEAVQSNRKAAEAKAPGSVLTADIVAGILPVTGAPGRVSKAKTWLQALRGAAGEGAVVANLPYDPSDERVTRTAIGAVLPGIVRATAAAPGAFMNQLRRIAARRADKQTQQLVQEAKAAFVDPNTGQPLPLAAEDYTIAQIQGDPRLSRLAGQSADVTARDAVNAQLKARVENIRAVASRLGGAAGIQDVPDRAKALYRAIDQHDMDMGKANSEFYANSVNKLLGSAEGQTMRVPLKAVMDEILNLEDEFGDILGIISKSATGTNLGNAIKTVKALEKGNVRDLKLRGLVKLQQQLNSGRLYGQAVVSGEDAIANKIRDKLQSAIRGAVEQGPDTPAYNQLRKIQSEYAYRSDVRRRIGDDQLTTLFGDKSVLADPEAAFDKFIRLNPEAQRMGVAILSHRAPEQLLYMRKRYLDQILDAAQAAPKAGMAPQLDPERLYAGLTSDALNKNPLFNPQERGWAAAAAKDLRVILNSFPDVSKVGTDLPPADLAINLISRSPEFMTRYLTRAATGLSLEDIMFTKTGREALHTMANLRTASQARKDRAAAYFIGLVAQEGENYDEQPQ